MKPKTRRPAGVVADRPARTSPLAGRVFLLMASAALILVLWFALRTVYQTGKALSSPETIWNLSQRARRVPALPADESVSVTIEHLRCDPACPAWSLTLFASGRVSWRGDDAVCESGKREGGAERESVARIVAGLERIDFDHLPVASPGEDAARAVVRLSLVRATAVRHLDYALDDISAPQVLKSVSARIESVAGSARWSGASAQDNTPQC